MTLNDLKWVRFSYSLIHLLCMQQSHTISHKLFLMLRLANSPTYYAQLFLPMDLHASYISEGV